MSEATPHDPEDLFDPNEELDQQMRQTSGSSGDTPAAEPTQAEINARLVTAIESIAQQNQGGPIKQIPLAKAKIRTPWNPTGSKLRPRLRRTTRMNGFRLQEATLTDTNIRLLNALVAGKYNGGRWVVIESDDREGTSVDLMIQNKSIEDRLRNKSEGGNLEGILRKILTEAGVPAPVAAA